jgi:hypothetical protein
MRLELTEYRLHLGRPVSPGEATWLRGYFASAFPEEPLAHQHQADGKLRYDYPLVQFKVLDREALLVGVGDGGRVVERAWREVESVDLAGEQLPMLEGTLSRRRVELGDTDEPVHYRFATPWLGLNHQNHLRYREANVAERSEILARALVGNCLSMSKSLGLWVERQLEADTRGVAERTCLFKGIPMLGFTGRFSINFRLPSGLGIGKSVSRGFGTVEERAHEVEGRTVG